jgi:hypothetical protein
MSSGAMMRPCRASSSATTDRDGAKRALDRAVVEARDRHMRTAVVSVASMPIDLDAPRYYGTLDDISPDEGRPLSPPPEIVAHLEEAREILAAAGVDSELTSAPVSRATRSSRWRGTSDPLCRVPPFNGGALWPATCALKPKSCSA